MSDVIKKWEYTDYDNKTNYVEYRTTGVFFVWMDKNGPFERSFSAQSLLIRPFCIGNHTVDMEVCQFIAQNYNFEKVTLSDVESKHLRFWKNINFTKLPNLTILPPSNNQYFLEISPEGLRGGSFDFNSKEKRYTNNYRLDRLFFNGPRLAAITLDDRKKIQETLLNALNPLAEFTTKDAFLLFDYSKIPSKKWEYSYDNGFSGDYVELNSDKVIIGGWDNPHDGASRDESIEEVWTRRPNFIDKVFGTANEELEVILSNAIIKE